MFFQLFFFFKPTFVLRFQANFFQNFADVWRVLVNIDNIPEFWKFSKFDEPERFDDFSSKIQRTFAGLAVKIQSQILAGR